MKSPLETIDFQINYYNQSVLERLSDYDKGIHVGRVDGLRLAKHILLDWVKWYRKEKKNGKD